MVSFFKENDIFRLIISLLILLAIRIPVLIFLDTASEQEVFWLTLGEKVASGSHPYSEVWTGFAPLSVLFSAFLVWIFGKSHLALSILGLLLTMTMVVYFSILLENRRVYNSKNQLVPFIFVLLSSLDTSFYAISPAMIATAFMMLTLNNLFSIGERTREAVFIRIGIYFSIAVLFYSPFIVFLVLLFFSFAFSGFSGPRGIVFTFLGAVVVWSFCFLYFVIRGAFADFVLQFVFYRFYSGTVYYSDVLSVLLLCAFFGFFVVVGWLRAVSSSSFLNYQQTCQFLMLVWAVCVVAMQWVASDFASSHVFAMVVPATFFVVNFLLQFKRKRPAEISGWLVILFSVGFAIAHADANGSQQLPARNLIGIKGKKVLALSREPGIWLGNKAATKYFDWHITRRLWLNVDSYDKILIIEKELWRDVPEVIFDPEGVAKPVLDRLPAFKRLYEQKSPSLWSKKTKPA